MDYLRWSAELVLIAGVLSLRLKATYQERSNDTGGVDLEFPLLVAVLITKKHMSID